jgi:hypothetical protein
MKRSEIQAEGNVRSRENQARESIAGDCNLLGIYHLRRRENIPFGFPSGDRSAHVSGICIIFVIFKAPLLLADSLRTS